MPIISPSDLSLAVQALRKGEVVAIPTETVYGLAGAIDQPAALEKIFKTKERPFFDPLIVHVHDKAQAAELTYHWSPLTDFLADSFWPGPLTMILPKQNHVNSLITSGLDSVGIRCPKHPVALELIRSLGTPLAAPSANRFGRTSPTTALHVVEEFPALDLLVLDGGPCQLGIESTVLKIEQAGSSYDLYILRKGLITQTELTEKLNQKNFRFQFLEPRSKQESPGTLEHHYVPPIPVVYCSTKKSLAEVENFLRLKERRDLKIGSLILPGEATLAARELYSNLRLMSETGIDAIVFFAPPGEISEEWEAVLDRLYRASEIRI